jgi:hypothetical protein
MEPQQYYMYICLWVRVTATYFNIRFDKKICTDHSIREI